MKKEEIKKELALGIRSFIEAKERSNQKAIDNFDELRLLEVSFNRLFISVEHLCNAVILFETGNFSKKHFGDFTKYKNLKERYDVDLSDIYQTTYNFRSYADYRKCPEVENKFKRKELKKQIKTVNTGIKKCLILIGKHMNIDELIKRIDNCGK